MSDCVCLLMLLIYGVGGEVPVEFAGFIEDSLDEQHGPFNKRPKLPSSFHQVCNIKQQGSTKASIGSILASQDSPLDEPLPLGLQLKKSPSFLDLIEMRLSEGNVSTLGPSHDEKLRLEEKKDHKGSSTFADKVKASNFSALLLKIGTWEVVSRYKGDLVVKCYYVKHKLVWEVLDGGLKSRMEIQWSDITALKANFPESGPGTLDIVLARQPLFFRESTPEPRKYTLWQSTSDFTGGQASIYRRHFLQCPQGFLKKNFKKLIQCDPRLNWLSRQPEIVLESPYFEPKNSIFEGSYETKIPGCDQLCGDYLCTFPDLWDPMGRDLLSQDSPCSRSVMDLCAIEDNSGFKSEQSKRLSHLNQLKGPELHSSMSMSYLVSHIGQCISEKMTSGNPLFLDEIPNDNMLEEIAEYLLSDDEHTSTTDEQSLMSRVNSLCCLLEMDLTTAQNSLVDNEIGVQRSDEGRVDLESKP